MSAGQTWAIFIFEGPVSVHKWVAYHDIHKHGGPQMGRDHATQLESSIDDFW